MTASRSCATILLSGGIDSAACAHLLLSQGHWLDAIFLDHGQAAAARESAAARALAKHLSIPIRELKISGISTSGIGEIVGRNAMLIFSALFSTEGRTGLLSIGVHAGTPYYDCSGAFVSSAARLVAELSDGRVSLIAPFLTWSKRDVFDYFLTANVPLELTYSCEAGADPTCGICASCRDRDALGC